MTFIQKLHGRMSFIRYFSSLGVDVLASLLYVRQDIGDDRRTKMANPKTKSPHGEGVLAHTIEAASCISTCGRTSIYAAIKSGALTARKIGRRTIILDEDLRRWLASLPMREVA